MSVVLAWAPTVVFGGGLSAGDYAVWLQEDTGARQRLATVLVADDGGYSVTMAQAGFSDYFLSMRPFRCLDGDQKLWCHVPYPYEIKRNISNDLVDLEYDFLFLWKDAGSYGIDLWNGVYYVLEPSGNGAVGQLHEIDMNELSVPPEAGQLRPVKQADLEPGEEGRHWLPTLVIEAVE